MIYEIDTQNKEWARTSKNGHFYALGHVCDWSGSVKVSFSYKGTKNEYCIDDMCIPLFLEEINEFISNVNEKNSICWNLGMSPFSHGLIKNGALYISTLSGKNFNEAIIDQTDQELMKRLKEQIKRDMNFHGRLLK